MEANMKRYCVKCQAGKVEFFDIVAENDDAYEIRHTTISNGVERVTEETMSRHLFEMCTKTGYIFEMEASAVTVA